MQGITNDPAQKGSGDVWNSTYHRYKLDSEATEAQSNKFLP